ncbi:RICIN domain-containing protein [Sorangium cellulosum]|uniref:RICIN domain-containing protein n=1 Tax=Sorangium cellulosum TaxID=56 RepID=UPI0018F70E17|nr:RICIN domain-containing protein [Sorangium cellulosum]
MTRRLGYGPIFLLLGACGVDGAEGLAVDVQDDSAPVVVSSVSDGTYLIKSVQSGKCLDISGGSKESGARVQVRSCNGAESQKFQVSSAGGGAFKIANVGSGKALDVAGGSLDAGAALRQWDYVEGEHQQFTFVNRGGNDVSIQAVHTGMALDIYRGSTADGAAIVQWPWRGGANQRWTFDKVDGGTTGPTPTPGGDDILVPASGAWLGQYYGDGSISQTSARLGRTLKLHLTYYDFTHNWVGSVTKADLDAGRVPFVNWEVFDTPLDEIIDGSHDAMLAQRARDAKALGKKLFVDFGAEMNGEWSPWGGAQNGRSPDKYIAAYRHVHDALRSADNIVWVWCPNVTDEPRQAWNQAMGYYPGDDYVDWTCVDGYNWGSSGGGGWQSFRDVFKNIYPKLAAKGKPIMIGEMASAESGGNKAAWIDQMIPTLRSDYPLIKGVIWFDVNKETDWRIRSSSASLAAFVRMANDPYFNP